MNAIPGYWTQTRQRRRRLLAAAGGASALAALTLAGCGGKDDSKPKGSRLVDTPEDSTARAIPGGIVNFYTPADVQNFDGLTPLAFGIYWNDYAYSRLLNFHIANKTRGESVTNAVVPYAAQSWDTSPDGLQYTFRLQPEARFDPRPPTSSRAVDAQDILFSWDRYRTQGRYRSSLASQASPTAPVVSVTAPDARTVVFKLKEPTASFLSLLAYYLQLPIYPREADGGFDPKQAMRGSGPWMLTDYKPSVSLSLRRNPNFHIKDRPFLDGTEQYIIPEYTQALAQFKAGNLPVSNIKPEDVLQTKADVPALRMYAIDSYSTSIGFNTFFSFKQGSVLRDERVRRAMSMLIDRDLFIDVQHNLPAYEKAGLPVPKRWSSFLPPGEEGQWLDPQGKDFGNNARFFKNDPAEAKKLVLAANGGPIEQSIALVQGSDFGPLYKQECDALIGMWEAGGDFKLKRNYIDFNTVFLPRYGLNAPSRDFEGRGGMAIGTGTSSSDVDGWLTNFYSPEGSNSRLEPGYPNDAEFDGLVRAQRTELDRNKRAALLHELQRVAAARMYALHRPGYALGYGLYQPWLGNLGAFGYRVPFMGSGPAINYWLDKSKV